MASPVILSEAKDLSSSRDRTITGALRAAAQRLAAHAETPRLDAEVLLRHALNLDRTELFAKLRDPVPASALDLLDQLIDARIRAVPVAYLTGRREFYGRDFLVGPGVLIPRPESELLVEWALPRLESDQALTVVDVGTGSGAIALTIAAETARRVIAVDRYRPALRYAALNRSALGLVHQVDLVHGDLVAAIRGPADLILANLPYLRPGQRTENPDLQAEPESALVSGPDGLDAISRLIADLPRALSPRGAVGLELDPVQAPIVAARLAAILPDHAIAVHQDLARIDRFVVAIPR